MPLLRAIAFAAVLWGNSSGLAASPAVTPQAVRAAVERSLPVIEKVGTKWIEDRKCNSCHVVTFMVWSHNAAAAHGLKVDRKKLDEWTDWALADSLKEQRRWKLRPPTMEALKVGVEAEIFAKLKPLAGKGYQTEKEYLEAVEKAIGAEATARHREQLVKWAALPNDGGGPDTLGQLLLGRSSEPGTKVESYAAIRALLLEWQEPNGGWGAAGQIPSLKWGDAKEMNDATTLWSLLALNASGGKDEAVVGSRSRAREYLKTSKPGLTVQSLALHLGVAQQVGESKRVEELRHDLLVRQNQDGGWGWMSTNQASNAFATGQALYALGLSGRDGNDPAVQRAWQFLLETQTSEGGWEVPQNAINVKERKLNVYPFWGNAWAAIGMLQTLPADGGKR
jgi:hypothetical protein